MTSLLIIAAVVISGCLGTPLENPPAIPLQPQPRAAILLPTLRDPVADNVDPAERNSHICGIRRSSVPDLFNRVVGGSPVEKHEFPWQVSLQWRMNWFTYHICGAAIVDQNWVVTAAHCIQQFKAKDLIIVAGEHQLKFKEGTEQTRSLSKIIAHRGYNSNTQQNDIALLKLSSPLILDGATASPVCLPPYRTGFSGHCIVSGWGKLGENGQNSDVLQKVMVPIISDRKCKQSYSNIGYSGPITDSMICAGYSSGGRDACQGDSGGPYVCRGPDRRYYLAGIVSWGVGCARPNVPGVYTEVSHYVDWIFNVISNRVTEPVESIRVAGDQQWGNNGPWVEIRDNETVVDWNVDEGRYNLDFEGQNRNSEGYNPDFEGHNRNSEGQNRNLEGQNRNFEGQNRNLEGHDPNFERHNRNFEGQNPNFEELGQETQVQNSGPVKGK